VTDSEFEHFTERLLHDLREPLRMVTLYSGLLEKTAASRFAGDEYQFVQFMCQGALQMDSLLTATSSYLAYRQPPSRVFPVDLNFIVTEAVQELNAGETVTAGTLPEVIGDDDYLRVVMCELIRNALRFHTGLAVAIRISFEDGAILVRDNGLGFDNRYAERIFKPFQRLHGKEYGGHGLGLATVKNIIEGLGGSVSATSKTGEGTCVQFSLPVA
jgi:light-regulated signal transduction histidine kinase (bacteriophytochrome)